jgi:hypothetical protein
VLIAGDDAKIADIVKAKEYLDRDYDIFNATGDDAKILMPPQEITKNTLQRRRIYHSEIRTLYRSKIAV